MLLKCRLRFIKPAVGPRVSNELSDDAYASGPWATLWVTVGLEKVK